MLKVTTESDSVYEIDPENKKIRRVFGIKPTTPRIGEEGNWRTYMDIFPHPNKIRVGVGLLISWRWNEESQVLETTLTSPVKFIQSEDITS